MIDLNDYIIESTKHLSTPHIFNFYIPIKEDRIGFVNILAKKIYIWGLEKQYIVEELTQEQYEYIKLLFT